MSTQNDFIKVGKMGKTHGTNGGLRLYVEDRYQKEVEASSVFFIQLQGHELPFFIEKLEQLAYPVIKFEDVNSKEEAHQLSGKALYLRRSDIRSAASETQDDLSLLNGFELIDETLGTIGQIEEVVEYPEQLIAVLQYKGKEVMIPLHESLITGIDPEKQQLRMDLPEGLLEL
jgi:16S rRNA processing protein RimM